MPGKSTARRRLSRLGLCAVLLATGHTAVAGETERESAALGALAYQVHCRSCHGAGGAGDGPMAEVLKIEPADLTRLAAGNRGEFPEQRVYRAIDGRDGMAAHGTREMPVWGIGFQDPGRDSDQEALVREKILDLVAYLKTLQMGAGSDGEGAEDDE